MKIWLLAFLLVALSACSKTPDKPTAAIARDSTVVVLIRYTAQAGREEQALSAISELVATVRAVEPQTSGITILRDTEDNAKITLIEHWPSQEQFLGPHMKQPHILQFMQRSREFLAGPPDISFWYPAEAS
jgi:quinol monooxygenase YgiN